MSSQLRWYVQREKKAAGPYSLQDLKDQVRQGVLLGHDLVFREGGDAWKRAFDWPELATEIFSEERTSFTRLFALPKGDEAEVENWVVLIRIEEKDGLRFKQEGPYTTEHVRGLLQAQTLKPSDHVWKKGFEKWAPIYTRDEFSASLWNVKDDSVPMLGAVQETPPEDVIIEAPPIPATVKIPDSALAPEPQFSLAKMDPLPPPEKPRTAPKVAFDPTLMPPPPMMKAPRKKPSAWRWSLALGFVAVAAGLFVWKQHKPLVLEKFPQAAAVVSAWAQQGSAFLGLSSKPVPENTSLVQHEEKSPPSPEPLREEVAVAAPAPEVATPPEPTPEPKKIEKVEKKAFAWAFRLPGREGTPVVFMINGASGKILDLPALSLKANLKMQKDGGLEVEPKALGLPEGRYQVQIVQKGRVVEKSQRSFISDMAGFEQKLKAHRKQIVFEQQQEKRVLLRSLDEFEKFLKKQGSSLEKPLSSKVKAGLLKSLKAIERSELKKAAAPRHELIYANGWESFSTHFSATKELIEEAGSRKPAATRQGLEGIRKKVGFLKTQVARTSMQ